MGRVVCISGISGAGKTEIADALGDQLGAMTVVHWDDYDELTQSPSDYVEWFEHQGTYDEWVANNLENTLRELKMGKGLTCPGRVIAPNGNLRTLCIFNLSKVALGDLATEAPDVVTREVDVLPAQRG